MYDGRQGGMVLIGVVSWGMGCGVHRNGRNVPAVYAKVDHVLPWINNIKKAYPSKH